MSASTIARSASTSDAANVISTGTSSNSPARSMMTANRATGMANIATRRDHSASREISGSAMKRRAIAHLSHAETPTDGGLAAA